MLQHVEHSKSQCAARMSQTQSTYYVLQYAGSLLLDPTVFPSYALPGHLVCTYG